MPCIVSRCCNVVKHPRFLIQTEALWPIVALCLKIRFLPATAHLESGYALLYPDQSQVRHAEETDPLVLLVNIDIMSPRRPDGAIARMAFSHLSNLVPNGIKGHEALNRLSFTCTATWNWNDSCVTTEWQYFRGGCERPAQQYASTMFNIGIMLANNGDRNSSAS
jgi:hypothetical protein